MNDVSFPKASGQAEAANKIFGIIKRLKSLPKISAMGEVIRDELEQVYALLTDELPGIPGKGRPARFSKPSLNQVLYFCKAEGKPVKDGEWFFLKCEGNGWKNNGKAIVNWESTMRAWWLSGVFPSQKQQRVVPGPSVSDKDLAKACQRAKEH